MDKEEDLVLASASGTCRICVDPRGNAAIGDDFRGRSSRDLANGIRSSFAQRAAKMCPRRSIFEDFNEFEHVSRHVGHLASKIGRGRATHQNERMHQNKSYAEKQSVVFIS